MVGAPDRTSRLSTTETAKPWPEGQGSTRTFEGVAQRFEGGAMLFVPHEDGHRSILVLSTYSEAWREYPD